MPFEGHYSFVTLEHHIPMTFCHSCLINPQFWNSITVNSISVAHCCKTLKSQWMNDPVTNIYIRHFSCRRERGCYKTDIN